MGISVGKINTTVSVYYKGRSINKLQNGAVAWIFKISKNAKYTLCRKFILGHPVRICKQWRYCGIVSRWLIWQRCRLSSHMEQRARCSFFLWAKGHTANAIHREMCPVYGDKWPNEENAVWTEICLRQRFNGPFVSGMHSSWLRFFCIGHSQTCWKMGQMFK